VRDLGRVEVALPVGRRVAGRQQHRVAIGQRDVEHLGEDLDHLAAGPGAAGLEEAEMAGRCQLPSR